MYFLNQAINLFVLNLQVSSAGCFEDLVADAVFGLLAVVVSETSCVVVAARRFGRGILLVLIDFSLVVIQTSKHNKFDFK